MVFAATVLIVNYMRLKKRLKVNDLDQVEKEEKPPPGKAKRWLKSLGKGCMCWFD